LFRTSHEWNDGAEPTARPSITEETRNATRSRSRRQRGLFAGRRSGFQTPLDTWRVTAVITRAVAPRPARPSFRVVRGFEDCVRRSVSSAPASTFSARVWASGAIRELLEDGGIGGLFSRVRPTLPKTKTNRRFQEFRRDRHKAPGFLRSPGFLLDRASPRPYRNNFPLRRPGFRESSNTKRS